MCILIRRTARSACHGRVRTLKARRATPRHRPTILQARAGRVGRCETEPGGHRPPFRRRNRGVHATETEVSDRVEETR